MTKQERKDVIDKLAPIIAQEQIEFSYLEENIRYGNPAFKGLERFTDEELQTELTSRNL